MSRKTLAVAIASACLAAGAFAQSQNLTMQMGGAARKYILYAPTGLPSHPPLIYVIHGFNMTGQQEVGLTRMNAVADKERTRSR
jgi:poly(3-hydroxybutyrate) depolymerase